MTVSRSSGWGLTRGALTVAGLLVGACAQPATGPARYGIESPVDAPAPAPMRAATVSSAATLDPDTVTMLHELETTPPARSERQPRPAESGPVAFVPRVVRRDATATIVVREEPGGAILSREVYRLSPERVSVTDDGGGEWWLGRNPLHPDELSGATVIPAEHLLLVHSAGDLRLTGNEQLWDRIAALGSQGDPTAGLVRTGREERAFGLSFEEWVAPDEVAPLRDLLWNASEGWALRSRAVVAGQGVVREITALEWTVHEAALLDPLVRHPDWQRTGISDLEDCAEAHPAHVHDATHTSHGHQP